MRTLVGGMAAGGAAMATLGAIYYAGWPILIGGVVLISCALAVPSVGGRR